MGLNTHTEKYTSAIDFVKDFVGIEQNIIQQIQEMFKNCFQTEWDGSPNMEFVVQYTYDDADLQQTFRVDGFLSVFPSKYTPDVMEIYNVCVHPTKRGQKVLNNLFAQLEDEYYYILGILFENKAAYYAYSKHFFCDFVAIGRLSLMNDITFILGGRKSTRTTLEKKQSIRQVFDHLATKVIPFVDYEHVLRSIFTYPEEYAFLQEAFFPLRSVLVLPSSQSFIKLSDPMTTILSDNKCLHALQYRDLIVLMRNFYFMFHKYIK